MPAHEEAPGMPAEGNSNNNSEGINLDSQWTDTQGRPQSIVPDGGMPIPGLG